MIATNQPSVVMTMDELNEIIRKAAITAAREVLKNVPESEEDTLWDAEGVGQYLGVSPHTINYKWRHQTGFPAAIELGEGLRVKSRWKASDVKAWAVRQKAKKAA